MISLPDRLERQIEHSGLSWQEIVSTLKSQKIETPSWGYADSGTRFFVFKQPAAAKTIEHKIQDAAAVHRFTGIAPTVALHIPWDKVDDWKGLRQYADSLGVAIGSINPNLFQEDVYKLGSITHTRAEVRRRATEHLHECVQIMRGAGSHVLSLWFADGTNYPGQGHFRRRKAWLLECLREIYAELDPSMILLLEYKFFEPGFYHTDLADWGMAFALCLHLGPQAKVLVDLGHHAHGVNIEHLVAFLIDEKKLGGFHFNNRKYADDDLTVGSINPYELFLIYHELVEAELDPFLDSRVEYMIDQSHNVKPKVEAMLQSVLTCQKAYAKALLVDRRSLREAQDNGDIVAAEECLVSAFECDVEPLLEAVRAEMGLNPHPLEAFRQSGYVEAAVRERAPISARATLG